MADSHETIDLGVLVIGAGAAGARTAIELVESGVDPEDVLIIGKRSHGDAHTTWARGGINGTLGTHDPEDDWTVHAADTLEEGHFLDDPAKVETVNPTDARPPPGTRRVGDDILPDRRRGDRPAVIRRAVVPADRVPRRARTDRRPGHRPRVASEHHRRTRYPRRHGTVDETRRRPRRRGPGGRRRRIRTRLPPARVTPTRTTPAHVAGRGRSPPAAGRRIMFRSSVRSTRTLRRARDRVRAARRKRP